MTVRTLALVDIENLLAEHGRLHQPQEFSDCLGWGCERGDVLPTDHVVVGMGPKSAKDGCFAVRGARPGVAIRVRGGFNGADLALCDEAFDLGRVAARYQRVVVASGDHEFATLVAALGGLGVHTCVVSWKDRLSRSLALAAREVRLLDDLEQIRAAARAA